MVDPGGGSGGNGLGDLNYLDARAYYQACANGAGAYCPDTAGIAEFAAGGLIGAAAVPILAGPAADAAAVYGPAWLQAGQTIMTLNLLAQALRGDPNAQANLQVWLGMGGNPLADLAQGSGSCALGTSSLIPSDAEFATGGGDTGGAAKFIDFSGNATASQYAIQAVREGWTVEHKPFPIPSGPYEGTVVDQYIYTSPDGSRQLRLHEAMPGYGNTGWQARVSQAVSPEDPNVELASPPNKFSSQYWLYFDAEGAPAHYKSDATHIPLMAELNAFSDALSRRFR